MLRLEKRAITLTSFIEDLLASLQVVAENEGISLIFDGMPEGIEIVYTDETRLRQILCSSETSRLRHSLGSESKLRAR